MLRHVIRPAGRPAGASPYSQPTWIFSHRELPRIDGADLRFVCGDVRPVREEILAAAKDVNFRQRKAAAHTSHHLAAAAPCLGPRTRRRLCSADLRGTHAGLRSI